MSFAQTFNSSKYRSDYKDVFKNFCELYYPPSTDFQQGPCAIFVEGLYFVIDKIDPIHHCDQIRACGQPPFGLARQGYKSPGRSNQVICEFCEQLIGQIQAALSNPNTVDIVRRNIGALCDYLSVIDQDKECKQLAYKYFDQAISFIKSIDPLRYCRTIQMCSVSDRKAPAGSLPTLTDFNNFGIETSVLIGERPSSREKNNEIGAAHYHKGVNCQICKTFVKEMFHFLRNNRTEANIVAGLDKVCKLIYKDDPKFDECDGMVKAYTREIIQLLVDETDPEIICMLLEQCTYEQPESFSVSVASPNIPTRERRTNRGFGLSELISALDPSIKAKSGTACIECKMFIKYLKNTLDDTKTRNELKDWLMDNLCSELSDKDLINSCNNMVTEYADVFFETLAGDLNPQAACVGLGVCSGQSIQPVVVDNALSGSQSVHEPRPAPESTPGSVHRRKCWPGSETAAELKGQICERIVTKIDEYLSTHSIDNDVSVLIDQVCNKMPQDSLRNECVVLVTMFGSEIAQAIATMDNPRQLCSKIALS